MKYATFDANGVSTAFYGPDVHGPLLLPVYGPAPEPTEDDPNPAAPQTGTEPNPAYPPDVVEVTDAQWLELLQNPQTRRWQNGAVVEVAPPAAPVPPRRATLAALFDPLSAAQRASITADHLMRLQADAAAMPDGTVYVGSSKVNRAAGDLGLTPDAWFKLAGV